MATGCSGLFSGSYLTPDCGLMHLLEGEADLAAVVRNDQRNKRALTPYPMGVNGAKAGVQDFREPSLV